MRWFLLLLVVGVAQDAAPEWSPNAEITWEIVGEELHLNLPYANGASVAAARLKRDGLRVGVISFMFVEDHLEIRMKYSEGHSYAVVYWNANEFGRTPYIRSVFPEVPQCTSEESNELTSRKILDQIFEQPVRSDVVWTDIESLLEALGAEISEGRRLRVWVALKGVKAVFHRPHPRRETDKGAVVSVRRFLSEAGVENDEV